MGHRRETWSGRLPDSLTWLGGSETGRSWLASLPGTVTSLSERWLLDTGPVYEGAHLSLVLDVTQPDGSMAVLKIPWPHRESEHEADALGIWAGKGVVRLLDHDQETGAMLLERCNPGTNLSDVPHDEALGVYVGMLPRLWRPGGNEIGTLAGEAARWVEQLPQSWEKSGRRVGRRLIDAAVTLLDDLAGTQGEQVLLHQDLHPDNVLRAEREPWLAIDPKPLVGEREFAPAPIIRAVELGHDRRLTLLRFDRLTDELALDRDRTRGWAIGQTMAWAFENDQVIDTMIETASWLLDAKS